MVRRRSAGDLRVEINDRCWARIAGRCSPPASSPGHEGRGGGAYRAARAMTRACLRYTLV